MSEIAPDFLRAIISTTANVLLMCTILQPKYSKKVTFFTMLGILSLDLGSAIYFYLSGNLTMLAKFDIILFAVLCFVVRPVFKDNFMQWLFSYLTVQNISMSVVVLSFFGSRRLPYPVYSNSILRLILFGIFFLILKYYVRPLYRQVVKYWIAYFAVALAINITFMYYVLFSKNIIVMLTEQAIPLLLIILIEFAAYGSIFLSLKILQGEYKAKEEHQKIQAEREYLQLAADNMSERLKLMEEVSVQNSRSAHDRRHFNNMLLEFLEQGEYDAAVALLKKQNQTVVKISKMYCENPIVNAAVSHYVKVAEQSGIHTDILLEIPNNLKVDSLEFSMVVSNLLENAIVSCSKQPASKSSYVKFICHHIGRLLLEIENTCSEDTLLDDNGYPITCEEGHGVGSKSVIAFAKKYNGELIYKIDKGIFQVRLLV